MQSNKYNDKLIIRENDSHSMILKQIEPNSIVLEFGCANGAMTQYMKETLDCKVYIVEYDKEAYQDAIQFAEDGICGDIMDFEWVHRFGIKFDYILFADVLEHLADPKTVLSYTKELLKEKGNVIVSVPNIAHNDIIRKLLLNHFDYTDIGLLDDTHIHFFAYKNLKSFTNQCGYYIKKMEYVFISDWQTEQFRNHRDMIDRTTENYLCQRYNGTVYQYIMTLSLDKQEEIEFSYSDENIEKTTAKIYFNRGNGFSEEDIYLIGVKSNEAGIYTIDGVIDKSLLTNVEEIRIDPIEEQECIIGDIYILQGNRTLNIQYVDGIDLTKGILLNSNDPMMNIKLDESECDIKILCHFMIRGEVFIKILLDDMINKKKAIDDFGEEYLKSIDSIKNDLLDRESMLEKCQEELSERYDKIIELHDYLRDKDNKIIQLQDKLKKCDNLITEMQKILENKDDQITEMQKILENKDDQITEMQDRLAYINKELLEAKNTAEDAKGKYEHIINTKSWKITAPLRKIYIKK